MASDSVTAKLCTKCGVAKPLSEFYRSGQKVQSACKPCHNKVARAWQRLHPEAALEASRRWHAKHPTVPKPPREGATEAQIAAWVRQRVDAQSPERLCRKCWTILPLSEFHPYKAKSRVTGETAVKYYGPCKPCKVAIDIARYNSDPEKHRARAKDYRQRNPDHKKRRWNKRAAALGGGTHCAACGSAEGRLCIDHCHKTGRLRGVLCSACNLALGIIREDVGRAEALIRYIKERCHQ